MEWRTWQPWYERIVERLNLNPEEDKAVAETLNKLLPENSLDRLKEIVKGRECIVFGAGPSLEPDISKIKRELGLDRILITADGATTPLIKHKNPDIIVTDLDGKVEDQLKAWRNGSLMVVHGHGDNADSVKQVVPKLNERIIGTTQTQAFGRLQNFGGFTDGDRAAFMARELGASKILLAGMDLGKVIGRFSGKTNKQQKLIKLSICKELLSWLSQELGARIENLTGDGEEIPGIKRVDISKSG